MSDATSKPSTPSGADVAEVVSAVVVVAGISVLVLAAFIASLIAGLLALGVALCLVGVLGVFVASRLDGGVKK